jgi:hypothetical protein
LNVRWSGARLLNWEEESTSQWHIERRSVMVPDRYTLEKLALEHRQQLPREIEHE